MVKNKQWQKLRSERKIKKNLQVLDSLQRKKAEGVPYSHWHGTGCISLRNFLSEMPSLSFFPDKTLLVFSPNSLGALQAFLLLLNKKTITRDYS